MEPKYLVFPIIFLLCYYIISVIFYMHVEGWVFLDSVYFMSSTLSLIGLGDFFPKTDMGKIYTSIFSIFGVINLCVFAKNGIIMIYVVDVFIMKVIMDTNLLLHKHQHERQK